MRNVSSNGLPSFVVPETRWTLREYAIVPSELITRSFTSALIGPLNMSRKPCQGAHTVIGCEIGLGQSPFQIASPRDPQSTSRSKIKRVGQWICHSVPLRQRG